MTPSSSGRGGAVEGGDDERPKSEIVGADLGDHVRREEHDRQDRDEHPAVVGDRVEGELGGPAPHQLRGGRGSPRRRGGTEKTQERVQGWQGFTAETRRNGGSAEKLLW